MGDSTIGSRDWHRRIYIDICIISICVLLIVTSIPIGSQNVSGGQDLDLCGLYRNYNTDNSREASIAYDFDDDEIWKMFYVGVLEYDKANYVHLWVYGKSFGTPSIGGQGYSHQIFLFNDDHSNGKAIYSFYSHRKFDKDTFHWQRFELPKSNFKPQNWNRVEIRDVDHWEINNLKIGIDKTFGNIDDFDQSYWYSAGAGVTPDNPRGNEGELMIALEFVDPTYDDHAFPELQSDWDDQWEQGNYDWIYLDDVMDRACWRTYLTEDDIINTRYIRLYIFAAAWTTDPEYDDDETFMNVNVNNQDYKFYPMKDFGACRPKGAWSWIEINKWDLIPDSDNTFYFSDTTIYQHTNLAIPRFTDVDKDQSKWRYCDGVGWHGTYNYQNDQGEMAVYLVLYDNELEDSLERTVSTIEISDLEGSGDEPYDPQIGWWLDPKTEQLGNNLGQLQTWNHYKVVQHDWEQENVHQGLLYDENDYRRGDRADFLVFSGHGDVATFKLPEYDGNEIGSESPLDRHSFDIVETYDEGFTEADNYGWPWDFDGDTCGQDGYNFNTEWVLFLACNVLGKKSGENYVPDPDNSFQTLLYHNLHAVLGHFSAFSLAPGEMEDYMDDFYGYLTDGERSIEGAFIMVSSLYGDVNYHEPWAYFYNEDNAPDYLWGVDDVTRDIDMQPGEKFEQKGSIYYYTRDT